MNLELSINTENQEDITKALNIINSLSDTKSMTSMSVPVVVPDREYICKTSVGLANILEDDEGIYRILAGSVVAKDTSPSCSAKAKRMREEFIRKGIIEIVEEKGIVRKDIGDLLSKSLVASIVTGTNTNGNARLIEIEHQKSKFYSVQANVYKENKQLSEEQISDLIYISQGVGKYLDFVSREDITADMLNLYDFHQEGIDVIDYNFYVVYAELNVKPNYAQIAIHRAEISLFESVTGAYTWYCDFVRYLVSKDIPYIVKDKLCPTEQQLQEHLKVRNALEKCIKLCL